jgi:hypothetical protein
MGSEDQVHFTKTRVYVKLPYSINDKNPYRGQSKPIKLFEIKNIQKRKSKPLLKRFLFAMKKPLYHLENNRVTLSAQTTSCL